MVNLPPDLAGFVTHQLESGVYASEEELICAAVRALQIESTSLYDLIQDGLRDPEHDLIFEDDAALAKYFAGLTDRLRNEYSPQS